jgi:hypothetical protein
MTGFLDLQKGRKEQNPAYLVMCVGAAATAVIVGTWIAAFAVLQGEPGGVIYDTALSQAFEHRSDMLAAELPTLSAEVNGHATDVTDCSAFLSAARFVDVRTEWATNPLVGRYADCMPLRVLARAQRPSAFLAPQDQLGRLVAERLDLSSLDDGTVGALLPHGLSRAVGDAATLAALPSAQVTVGPRGVSVDRGRTVWHFDVVASVAVDRAGTEGLLLRTTWRDAAAEAEAGIGYAVLTQADGGHLRAVPVERLLLADSVEWAAVGAGRSY